MTNVADRVTRFSSDLVDDAAAEAHAKTARRENNWNTGPASAVKCRVRGESLADE